MKSFLFLLLAVFFAFLTQAQQAKPLVGANIILIKTGETGENAFKKWEKHLEQNGYKIDRSYIDVLTLSTVPKASGNNKFVYLIHTAVTPTGDMAIKLQWQATDNMENAEIKYSTVQNWYPGDKDGKGGIYNFVTKRGICKGANSKISWTQVETGSAITWKYPSVILQGDNSSGEFYSVAVTRNKQIADTGTKIYHLGKNTKSRIISKGISAGESNNSYRGLVQVGPKADNARNFTQCDSLLIGSHCGAHTFPYIETKNSTAMVEHEATTSKIGEDQIFYLNQRGIDSEKAVALIVNGYAKEVLNQLPMEFAVEAQKLLSITLEGSVG